MEDIPKQLTDASLKAHFKTYGKVVELKVMKTKTTNKRVLNLKSENFYTYYSIKTYLKNSVLLHA